MTTQRVRSANERLHQEHGTPKGGSASKPRKGKERAGPARSTAADARPGTADSSETYLDEVSSERPPAQVEIGNLCGQVVTDV